MAKVEGFADNAIFQRGITRVPFSPTTVRHLMVLQTRHDIHPYTCGNRGDGKHEKIGGQTGVLVPTANGWICPDCDYTQDWVHNSFLNAIIFDVAFDQPSHAPASTAPKEVIEKYARDLRMHNETRPLANTREKQEETLRSILTRFAAEIGMDTEKDELVKLLRVIEWKDQWSDSGEERCFWCHRSRIASNEHHAENCALAAALKSAGGGK